VFFETATMATAGDDNKEGDGDSNDDGDNVVNGGWV